MHEKDSQSLTVVITAGGVAANTTIIAITADGPAYQ